MSHNVRLANFFTATETASISMRSGDVLSMYIMLLTDGRTDVVGLIQGFNGLLQLLAALPAGWLADKIPRDRVLLIAAAVGLAAGLSMAWALFINQSVMWLGIGMLLLGIYKGVYNPPLEAIFADSLATGRARDSAYTKRYIVQQLANCTGPVQGIIMFAVLGNAWTASDCRFVLRVGICVTIVPVALLLLFDDQKSLGIRSESVQSINRARSHQDVSAAAAERIGARGAGRKRCGWMSDTSLMVPAVITVSDLFSALASGMATKFYIVFFVQQCAMKPVYSSALGIIGPISISIFSALVNRLAQCCDPIQITLVTKLLDPMMLAAMALLPAGEEHRNGLVLLHILRFGVANSSRPQLRSLMMDHVDKKHRGKWNAVDSIRTVSWSGSAMLGGFLIQNYGYQGTFLVSAAMKFAGWLLLLFLFPLIGRGCGKSMAVQDEGYAPLDSDEEDELEADAAAEPRPGRVTISTPGDTAAGGAT